MSFDAKQAAAELHARRLSNAISQLPAGLAPRTEAEGVAVQRARAALLHADPPAGFKIGATARKMQDYLGLGGPIAGFMRGEDLLASGAELRWSDLRGPGVECEIAVRLAHDLPPGPYTAAQAASAVDQVYAAIELVENRYGPPPAGDLQSIGVPTLVADQVYHRAAVLGAPATDWQRLDLAATAGRIALNGAVCAQGTGADLLGHPMQALAWLANSTTAHGFGGLRAGQVMMLGSVTPPIWLDGPCSITVTFDLLGEATLRIV